jgi:hypothetical protein
MKGMNTASKERMPISTAVTWPLIPIAQDRIDGDVVLAQRVLLILLPRAAHLIVPGIRLQKHLHPALGAGVQLHLTAAMQERRQQLMLVALVHEANCLAAEAQTLGDLIPRPGAARSGGIGRRSFGGHVVVSNASGIAGRLSII